MKSHVSLIKGTANDLTVSGILGLQLKNDAATLSFKYLFLSDIRSRNWISLKRIELRDRCCLSATSIRFTGKKNKLFFLYTIFLVVNLLMRGLQNNCANQTEGCLSQWENGIVGFFCTFTELWVALILGNAVAFFLMWCEKMQFFCCVLFMIYLMSQWSFLYTILWWLLLIVLNLIMACNISKITASSWISWSDFWIGQIVCLHAIQKLEQTVPSFQDF